MGLEGTGRGWMVLEGIERGRKGLEWIGGDLI